MIGGVCLGLATFFNIDVTIVRILFVLFALATGGWGILAYLGLMFILPRATKPQKPRRQPRAPRIMAMGRWVAVGQAWLAVGQAWLAVAGTRA